MFWATLSPIIRNTQLYSQLQVLSTDIAAGWYREFQFHLIHDTNQQQYRWTIPEAVNTVVCS
jgi:hypothetical protein